MATGSIPLSVAAATPPDGTTNNVGPRLLLAKGTNTPPNRFFYYAAFPKQVNAVNTNTYLWFEFPAPTNYASGGTVRLMWGANATTGAVVWSASVGTQASGATDSYLAHNQATAVTATTSVLGTTARRPVETQIALGANLDGMAAGRSVSLVLFRVATNAADTATVDAEVKDVWFDFTTT